MNLYNRLILTMFPLESRIVEVQTEQDPRKFTSFVALYTWLLPTNKYRAIITMFYWVGRIGTKKRFRCK